MLGPIELEVCFLGRLCRRHLDSNYQIVGRILSGSHPYPGLITECFKTVSDLRDKGDPSDTTTVKTRGVYSDAE